MIFGNNKFKEINQNAFYLDKDQIKKTHEYKYLRIDFYSHGYFEPSSKWQRMARMKALMIALRKEAIVKVTCWELKSHLFKALVLPIFTYATKIWGGDLKNSNWKAFEKGMKIHMMSRVKVHFSIICSILLATFGELHALNLNMGSPTTVCPPTLLLVSEPSILTSQTRIQHLAQINNRVEGNWQYRSLLLVTR